jgi:hypothetical protein
MMPFVYAVVTFTVVCAVGSVVKLAIRAVRRLRARAQERHAPISIPRRNALPTTSKRR